MKKQIDHFLLGLLWLLASTLGASFWFNTKFGFNIFTIQHWQYLGQLQASTTPVQSSFYISMIIIAIIMIVGLYIIVRPRFRKINFKPSAHMLSQNKSVILEKESELVVALAPATNTPTPSGIASSRPPRLNLPTHNSYAAAQPQQPATPINNIPAVPIFMPSPAPLTAAQSTPGDFSDIEEIFKSSGYVTKKTPRIGGLRPALFAIGADESLWIGAVGIEPSKLKDAVSKLNNIFTETLEDIQINIHPFIINPKVIDASDMIGIQSFDSLNALRDYMAAYRNRELPSDEQEDFDAYSEYIDTVADYFNKS